MGEVAPLASARAAAKRGCRIPDDFVVTHEMAQWAVDRVPGIDGRLETEKFITYWRGKSGKDATKVDWVATWQHWMLNARDRYGSGARASPGDPKPSTAVQRASAGLEIANRLRQQREDAERDTG